MEKSYVDGTEEERCVLKDGICTAGRVKKAVQAVQKRSDACSRTEFVPLEKENRPIRR